jgi:hypothetical protein
VISRVISRPVSFILVALFGLYAAGAIAGCAKPAVNIPAGVRIEGYDEASRRIAADPVRFLEESLEASKQVKAFTATFQRQERLGVLRELRPQENIAADYRDDPFSVRFTWLDDDSEYRQCVFVKGENHNNVALLPRKGVLGQPARVQSYPTSFAVLFGKARNPITDFGPRRMMERILDRIAKARKHGDVVIKLREPTEIGPDKEPCYYLELRYPPGDQFACKLQDLYISARTRLPVATWLWLPGKVERCGDTLDGMYVYAGLTPTDRLSDVHFEFDTDKRRALADRHGAAAAGSPAAGATNGGTTPSGGAAVRATDE